MSHLFTAITLEGAVNAYLDWHALRGSSARHRGDIGRMLLAFAGNAGRERPLAEITREDCEKLLRSVQERECKPNTQKAYHRVLDAFFTWLLSEERLAASPMARVPSPKVPQEQIVPLSPEELAMLLAQPDLGAFTGLRDAAFIALLADTGLRVSEALAIRIGDVDGRTRAITLVGKGRKPRTVFYGDRVEALLKQYLRRREGAGPAELLFINSLGEALCRFTMAKRLQAYGREAGIKGKRVSPHTLRHSFAVNWLMNGGDALSLQRLLGHTTPAMTSRYVNFATGDLAKLHRSVSPLDRLTKNAIGPLCPQRTEARRTRLR